jgi:DNA-binding transcriptional ArsR family regulator
VPPSTAAFEIWKAGDRIHSVDNPVRIEILGQLEKKPLTLKHLVKITGKAKSTLSAVHLQALLEAGLVKEAIDPKDARVKWYALAGSRLGASSVEKARLRDAVLQFVNSSGLIPLGPLLEVIDVARLVEAPGNASYAAGVADRLGRLLGRMVMATDPKDAARELSHLFEAAGLGKLEWSGSDVKTPARATALQRFAKATADAALKAWKDKTA